MRVLYDNGYLKIIKKGLGLVIETAEPDVPRKPGELGTTFVGAIRKVDERTITIFDNYIMEIIVNAFKEG